MSRHLHLEKPPRYYVLVLLLLLRDAKLPEAKFLLLFFLRALLTIMVLFQAAQMALEIQIGRRAANPQAELIPITI